ncbi:MAG: alpha/beta hydrolase [Bacteroidota bacterium]
MVNCALVYFISGLGADERAFRYLRLEGVEKRFIHWLVPEKNESLREYASRLIEQIDTTQPVTLVGLSFGGIIAQEIASVIECERVFLISSVKQLKELSEFLQLLRRTRLYRLLPFGWVKPLAIRLAPFWFDAVSERHRALLKNIINETDNRFAQWAINAIMRWPGNSGDTPVIHIHGTHDRVFPVCYLSGYIPIKGGGHFMIVTHAKPISALLQKHLNPQTI